MAIKVVATDLDGTLFYPKRIRSMMTKKNRRLIERFTSDGGRWVLVSSRGNAFLKKVQRNLGASVDIIGSNGAFIESDGKVIKDGSFSPKETTILVKDIVDRFHTPLFIQNAHDRPSIFLKKDARPGPVFLYFAYELFQGVYRDNWIRDDLAFYSEIEKGNCQRLMFWVSWSKRKARRAREMLSLAYPNFEFVDCQQFIEITPRGCSKASALSFYLDYNRLEEDNLIVVGDSGNDIPMFKEFYENSYCMKHSKPSTKKNAKHIIKTVSDLENVLYPLADSQEK